MCDGFVGGDVVVWACGSVVATLMGGLSMGVVSCLVCVCCFVYAEPGWECGATTVGDLQQRFLASHCGVPFGRYVATKLGILCYISVGLACEECHEAIAYGGVVDVC